MTYRKPAVHIIAAVALVTSCSHPPSEHAPTIVADDKGVTLAPDAPQWRYVELSAATAGEPLTPLPVPARIDLDEKRTSSVGSPLAGRVESVQVRLGARVKQGDNLFSVRSGAYADLDRELEAARAQVTVKQRVVERTRELYELKATAQKEVLQAEAELTEAELAFKAATAKQRSLSVGSGGDNLFWVRAPRDGTVVDLDLYSSQEVTPEREKPLMRISDLSQVLVLADVPESDVGELHEGDKVMIRTQANALVREATVEHVSEVVDPRRRTIEVRARAVNDDRALRPNAFVEVVPAKSEGTRIRVPDTAVVTDGNKSLVFVTKGPGRLEPIAVVTGRRRDGEVEIRGGLEVGTRYVSRGALLLLNQVDLAN